MNMKRSVACALLLTGVALVLARYVQADGDRPATELSDREAITALASDDPAARSRAAAILNDRYRTLEDDLIRMLDPLVSRDTPVESRRLAARLLGEMRSVKSVGALSNCLTNDFRIVHGEGHTPAAITDDFNTALFAIGRRAVPKMIENLRSSDDWRLVGNSRMVLLMALGSEDKTIDVLERYIEQESDQRARKRLEKAIADIRESGFKMNKPPLYY